MIALPVELTQAHAARCLITMQEILSSDTAAIIVVDSAALVRFDSSALAVLLELRRQCQSSGKQFAVAHLPEQLVDLAALYGITELLPAA